MTRKRWQQIEALFQAVQERGVDVLADADPELRSKVEAMLAQSSRGQILDRHAADLLDYFPEDPGPQLAAGSDLGPYHMEAPLGAGGMGEVWKARDTRLDRIVAIKVSKGQFTERFEREARAIAALNHPTICTLHDVGPNYLVMEFVDGPTLAERIKLGALPLDEALNIAKQIADALEAAHEEGIVHRDLKPGNIKVKPGGTVKVLDFGLAKVSVTPKTLTDYAPNITKNETEAGVILGTVAYMSPEQARGEPVDQRSDIYAFGAVLYEMVTGE
jgi:serine/threonine protein kinase